MNKKHLHAFAATVLLATSVVAACGAQDTANTGIDPPPPLEAPADVIDSGPEASEPTIEVNSEPAEPPMTMSQRNAVRAAEDYLDYTAFSRQGLIGQLEFDEFTTEDATFAVDHITVDWNEQAVKAAEDYLDYSAFSRGGLINQLEFDGFTSKQAEYGVAATGL